MLTSPLQKRWRIETWNASYASPIRRSRSTVRVTRSPYLSSGWRRQLLHESCSRLPARLLLYITPASDVTFTVDSTLPASRAATTPPTAQLQGGCTRSGDYLPCAASAAQTGSSAPSDIGQPGRPHPSTDCTKAPGCNLKHPLGQLAGPLTSSIYSLTGPASATRTSRTP